MLRIIIQDMLIQNSQMVTTEKIDILEQLFFHQGTREAKKLTETLSKKLNLGENQIANSLNSLSKNEIPDDRKKRIVLSYPSKGKKKYVLNFKKLLETIKKAEKVVSDEKRRGELNKLKSMMIRTLLYLPVESRRE